MNLILAGLMRTGASAQVLTPGILTSCCCYGAAARQAAEIAQSKLAHKLQYWLDANTALIVSVDVIHQQYIAKQAELDHLRGQMNQLRTQVERLVAVGVRH